VFELHYTLSEKKEMKAGQFMTFILPWVWGRSYSILELRWNIAILIIKRWPIDNGGRWGSIVLCDAEIWDEFKCVWPVGHFVLTEHTASRLFIWTGTGLVPLYSMILEWLKNNSSQKYQLVFWVRYKKDLFYIDKFEALKAKYPDTFYYHTVVSRDPADWIIHSWYVTDFLSPKVIWDFDEFYLCGAPAMIEGVENKLSELWVEKESIFFEKYA
jgi:ferredoxin-NADP reductase